MIGLTKEIILRGRFAKLTAADQRPFRPDEEKLFAESAQNAYKQFRNKAAFSRLMSEDKMEGIVQGRVWKYFRITRKYSSDYVPLDTWKKKCKVNSANLEDYIELVVDATINYGISRQMEAFKSGFNQVSQSTIFRCSLMKT